MSPKYLRDIMPSTNKRYASKNASNIPLVRVNNNYFMNIFFQSTITEWNKLDLSIQNSAGFNLFKGSLLQFLKPLESSGSTYHNLIEAKYLVRLRLGTSDLRYRKFKNDFPEEIDQLCSCSTEIENTVQFFFHCPIL